MHQIVDSNGVRIIRNSGRGVRYDNELVVGATKQPDGKMLKVEVWHKDICVFWRRFNPCEPLCEGVLGYPIMECLVRVLNDREEPVATALPNPKLGQGIKYIQIGWMPCVACSDQKIKPGKMWLGKNPDGTDIWCVCVECGGSCQVPRYKIVDEKTGVEIDYEAFGREEGVPTHEIKPAVVGSGVS